MGVAIVFLFGRKRKIGGIVHYLGLDDFWLSLTDDEEKNMISYYKSSLGASGSPIEGNISSSSDRPLNFLCSMLGWAAKDKQYGLAEKIIKYGMKAKGSLIDRHFFLTATGDFYYGIGDLDRAEGFYTEDVNIFPKYKRELMKDMDGILPRIPSFSQLAKLYEKQSRFGDAIAICREAMKHKLDDGTKGGYEGRISRLQKKS